VSRRKISDASATPLVIKCEWYVCISFILIRSNGKVLQDCYASFCLREPVQWTTKYVAPGESHWWGASDYQDRRHAAELCCKRYELFFLIPVYRLQKREELDSPAASALAVWSRKLSNALNGQSCDGWPKPYHLELLCASEGTLSRWSRLHLQSLAPTKALGPRGMLWSVLLVGNR
jgi:hypothetical protein